MDCRVFAGVRHQAIPKLQCLPCELRAHQNIQLKCFGRSGRASTPRHLATLCASRREEPDIAVLRFTLGIPGFDDGLIPRVLGVVGLLVIIVNGVVGRSTSDSSQVRAEIIGCILAGLCIVIPAVSKQLEENATGKGRKAAAAEIAGAIQTFKLADGIQETVKQELAWSTFALLKYTNSAGVLVYSQGKVLAARGAIKDFSAQDTLQELGKVLQGSKLLSQKDPNMYCTSADAVKKTGLMLALPDGVQSTLLVPGSSAQSDKNIIVVSWSGLPNSFSKRDREWTGHIADKLATVCSASAVLPV